MHLLSLDHAAEAGPGVVQARRQGWWGALRQLLLSGFHLRARERGTEQHSRPRQPRRQRAPLCSHQQRFAQVVGMLRKLPMEQYVSADGLHKLPAHQLKVSLRNFAQTLVLGLSWCCHNRVGEPSRGSRC